jgi:uncharacterized protein YuzE
MRNIVEFNVAYDRDADVLYITTPIQPAARGIEDENGLVWRYDSKGNPLGCTIIDFSEYWLPSRAHRLANILAEHLEIPVAQIETVISHISESEHKA